MKQYFKNLLTALLGRNPYQAELDRVREEYAKAADNVKLLRDEYMTEQEKASATGKLLREYDKLLVSSERQLTGFQTLVENLRERIRDYQQRIEEYNEEIDRLRQAPVA